jgi:hypothetical protein
MGLSIALFSVMALFSTAERVRLCFVLGLGIAGASPLISQLDWTGVHPMLKAYIVPDPNFFSFFPWAAFLAFGMSAGSVLRLAGPHHLHRTMIWSSMTGLALLFAGQYFSGIPYSIYPKSEFWIDNPVLILMKLGITLLLVSFAYLWTHTMVAHTWSWVAQLGTTSLLVYWVHIELVYGQWFYYWKDALNIPQTIAASAGIIALMVLLSHARTNWRDYQWVRRLQLAPEPAE